MTTEQAQKVLDELNKVRPEQLEGKARRLFEAIMSIADERDELRQKVKEINKGINSLMQSRKKWKYRYYKMKNKNKDLQKSVEQIYDDYQDIGKMAFDYSDKIEQKDKVIDLMADFLNKRSWREHQLKDDTCYCCKIEYGADDCRDCIKEYFENKAQEYK